jgi:hypothetical protein
MHMLERATWGSGQIARPGFPAKHPDGEFFWAHKLLGTIEKLLCRFETRVKQLLHHVWAGRLFGGHARG